MAQETIVIRRSQVPSYLHSGWLYRSFHGEDDEIAVPNECMKPDSSVHSLGDLEQLLLALRFWLMEVIPDEMIKYLVFDCKSRDEVLPLLTRFDVEFGLSSFVAKLWESMDGLVYVSAESGKTDFVSYFIRMSKDRNEEIDEEALLMRAAQSGNVDCLSLVLEEFGTKVSNLNLNTFLSAVELGRLACIMLLVVNGVQITLQSCSTAAFHKHFPCLKYLLRHSHFRVSEITALACQGGSLPCLEFAVEKGCEVSLRTIERAVGNSTECLQYLLENKLVEPDPKATLVASCRGSIEHMNMLLKHGWPLSDRACYGAAREGHLHLLHLLGSLGHNYLTPESVNGAAVCGQYEILKALYAEGCAWDIQAPVLALRGNHARCLHFLLWKRPGKRIPLAEVVAGEELSDSCRVALKSVLKLRRRAIMRRKTLWNKRWFKWLR